MRRCALPILLTVLATLAGCLPRANALGFLHARGEDVVDDEGRKFLFQGVGLGNWLLPEGYMWRFGSEGDRPRKIEKLVGELLGPAEAAKFWSEFRSQYITEADIKRIAEVGFNSVRVPLNARLFLTEGEHAVDVAEGFELLANVVRWCRQAGIYAVIDMHGAPGGQTGANIDDSARDQPDLFADKRNQVRLVELWVKIATRFRDEPAVAAYDLLNEPLPERTGAAAKYKQELEPLYRRITTAIRAVDKKHMITLEGADWANEWSVFTTRFDDNLLYQFHYYCWDRPDQLKNISQYLEHRKRLGAPVWVGETGEKDNAIYWATTDYFEANNIGWAFWPWKKMEARNAPYSIKAPEGWDQITAYSRGGTNPPARPVAQKAFHELLQNIRLAQCTYFPDVVNALFHRAPGRVEAENYGHEGLNRSYFIKEPRQNSKYYRPSEPVPVELIETDNNRWRSAQGIRLNAGEWTAYSVESPDSRSDEAVVRVKAETESAVFQLTLNRQAQEGTVGRGPWAEVKLKPAPLVSGTNRLALRVTSGTACFDWIDLR